MITAFRRFVLLALAFLAFAPAQLRAQGQEPKDPGEYIIVSGGVSLWVWEKWKAQPHDNWWMNFVRASRIRIQEIKTANPNQQITWLVFRPSYVTRGAQDSRDYLSLITSVRDAYGVKLMWFDRTSQLINYLNQGQNRAAVKINGFEYLATATKRASFLTTRTPSTARRKSGSTKRTSAKSAAASLHATPSRGAGAAIPEKA